MQSSTQGKQRNDYSAEDTKLLIAIATGNQPSIIRSQRYLPVDLALSYAKWL
jgi:hypothetical protein